MTMPLPYSKTVKTDGYIWLCFGGNSWNDYKALYATAKERALVLPPDADPKQHFWKSTMNMRVLAKSSEQTEALYRKKIAFACLSAGALSIDFILPEIYTLSDDDFFSDKADMYVEDFII